MLNLNKDELKFIKPFYDENEIGKYHINPIKNKYVIYLTKGNCQDITKYPNLLNHLQKYKSIMDVRRETKMGTIKWYQLHWPRKEEMFNKPKLIIPGMFDNVRVAYDDLISCFGLSTNIIVTKNKNYNLKFILMILNSKLGNYWFKANGKKRGIGVDIGVDRLRQFPIINIHLNEQKKVIDICEKILLLAENKDFKNNSKICNQVKDFEKQIDKMVYELYDLTPKEIEIIESSIN
jgi:adenine-specific DNA-methyltransferase